MDREKLQTFIRNAETELASVRSNLLLIAQTGDAVDIATSRRDLSCLKTAARETALPEIETLTAECEAALGSLLASENLTPKAVFAALDLVARIEAELFKIPTDTDDYPSDIADFVDSSFDRMMPSSDAEKREEFEIDEETFDIFRSEADGLLANIANGLRLLSSNPDDQSAIWDIRRHAHTFKGAAGIVGLKDASTVAHRMEDLLDKIVQTRCKAAPQAVDFLAASARRLEAIVTEKGENDAGRNLEATYDSVMKLLPLAVETSGDKGKQIADKALSGNGRPAAEKTTSTPTVRVSLDRLDDLIKVSHSLLTNGSAIAEQFAAVETGDEIPDTTTFDSLLAKQKYLIDEIQAKLRQIRMIKFGTLETRLSRAVNVTCADENKKASVTLDNGDIEIDTQIIDSLIEPLLHLLKNAVVHGIEPPDTRRLIGKPERGLIRISVAVDNDELVLSVADDGRGISVPKLIAKAIAGGIISAETSETMSDRDATELIFDRGLTTAEKLDLNAGRGVGMSIVKECVESHGGTVLVDSEPRAGSKFTIRMPLSITKPGLSATGRKSFGAMPQSASDLPLVLIVDDSSIIRHQTAKLVEESGLRVVTANNGAVAVELLLDGGSPPDLILSDVEMPQIDGWEFLEFVKTDDTFGHIPVIMVTSLNTDEHRHRAFTLGASDYIVKPLNKNNLEQIIEKVCGAVIEKHDLPAQN